jgi:hypothetical protein
MKGARVRSPRPLDKDGRRVLSTSPVSIPLGLPSFFHAFGGYGLLRFRYVQRDVGQGDQAALQYFPYGG